MIDVHKGQMISLHGYLLTYEGTEKSTAVFRDVRKSKSVIHGFETAKRTLAQYGYNLIKE